MSLGNSILGEHVADATGLQQMELGSQTIHPGPDPKNLRMGLGLEKGLHR